MTAHALDGQGIGLQAVDLDLKSRHSAPAPVWIEEHDMVAEHLRAGRSHVADLVVFYGAGP